MPSAPRSTAIALVSAITAPLDTVQAVRPRGRRAEIEETLRRLATDPHGR
jgi:hypothetical protein